MKLIESPNRWSCLPTSFAMILNISLAEMLKGIGHDGSEIIWPTLSEPHRRRAFHIQECVGVCLRLGFSVTQYDFAPSITPNGTDIFDIPAEADMVRRYPSVLIGQGIRNGHAVACDGKQIYDPNGTVYDIENQNTFTPIGMYIVLPISNHFTGLA